jgi:ABC-type bacteriocin/lantibiotic exporter with double-glycine peptidase domain
MADSRRVAGPLIGGVLVVLLGVGWFALSRGVMDTAVVDAVAESLGVILALLVVASIVGAVFRSRGSHG